MVAKLQTLQNALDKLDRQVIIYETMQKSGENLLDSNNTFHQKAKDFFIGKSENLGV